MKLYNSLTNNIEEFKSIEDGKVTMYVCGPTVYNFPHIGNARPIVVFDTLRRTLNAIGYEVNMVSNYTDIDDKIIKRAIEEQVSEKVIADTYITAYNNDRLSLHAMEPKKCPKVTETMPEIIHFIKELIEKGYAYEVGGDVYFRVSKIKDYGALSKQNIEDLQVGARIEGNLEKENPLDFTLWKATKEGLAWDTEWSKGRPGWHSECVVMIQEEFNSTKIDIHGGGMDLKFPHHENEIAQSEAMYGHKIANYWMHNGMINVDGEKMSKSLGNVLWVKDLVAQFGGNVIRWLLNSAHYRSPLNFNEETLTAVQTEYEKTMQTLHQAYVQLSLRNHTILGKENEFYHKFISFMCDDLNTPNALTVIFESNKKINQTLRTKEIDVTVLAELVYNQQLMLQVLGIKVTPFLLSEEQKIRYQEWLDAKSAKDFATADTLRAVLLEEGVL